MRFVLLDLQGQVMSNDELRDLAFEFFKVFSRLEYSLKAADFNRGAGPAEADWNAFAASTEALVAAPPTGEVADAISLLLERPPKKQFVGEAGLEWRSCPANTGSRAKELFTYIRRVRNNLFHGGKFNGNWFAPERSEQLLPHALLSCVGRLKATNEFMRLTTDSAPSTVSG